MCLTRMSWTRLERWTQTIGVELGTKNEKACEMYGYSREEMLALTIEDMSCGEPPYTQNEGMIKMKKAMEGTPQVFEWYEKRKNGELFCFI